MWRCRLPEQALCMKYCSTLLEGKWFITCTRKRILSSHSDVNPRFDSRFNQVDRLKEPRGFVAAHHWMRERRMDERLETSVFGPLRRDSKSDDETRYLDSVVAAQVSGTPVQEGFTYETTDSISDIPLLDQRLHANLSRMGFNMLTPIQRHAIGIVSIDEALTVPDTEDSTIERFVGKYDLMAAAQTGSGKTLAYLIPLINRLMRVYPYEAMQLMLDQSPCQFPSGLVLAPTRELVHQIQSEVMKLCLRSFVRPVSLFGGEQPMRQQHQLHLGCHVVVATPGRLLDFLRQGALRFTHCRNVVLDEADRMLDMGFEEQIRQILESPEYEMPKPDDRQTTLYSATFPREVTTLARNFLRGSRCISLTLGDDQTGTLVPDWGQSENRESELKRLARIVPREIDQRFEVVDSDSTTALYQHLIDLVQKLTMGTNFNDAGENDVSTSSSSAASISQVLIFCNTKREVDQLDAKLYQNGVKSAALHGDKSQVHRSRALDLFRRGVVQVLVASSVAARGLDIPNVTAVINVGLPVEVEDYVHRVGRTGRMGRSGEAITVVNQTFLEKAPRHVVNGILRIVQSSSISVNNVPPLVLQAAKWNESNQSPNLRTNRYRPAFSNRNQSSLSRRFPFNGHPYPSRR